MVGRQKRVGAIRHTDKEIQNRNSEQILLTLRGVQRRMERQKIATTCQLLKHTKRPQTNTQLPNEEQPRRHKEDSVAGGNPLSLSIQVILNRLPRYSHLGAQLLDRPLGTHSCFDAWEGEREWALLQFYFKIKPSSFPIRSLIEICYIVATSFPTAA